MRGFLGEYLLNCREWEKQRPRLAGQSTESIMLIESDRLVVFGIHQQSEGSGIALHGAVSGVHQQRRPQSSPLEPVVDGEPPDTHRR